MATVAEAKRKRGRKRERTGGEAARRQAEQARRASDYRTIASQDIGLEFWRDLARGPVNRRRRLRATRDLGFFCRTYDAETFYLPWSKPHERAIAKIEGAAWDGESYALGMARGGGKSSLCYNAVRWGTLCGHVRYPVLIKATANSAGRVLKSMKMILRRNPLLAEDFPEIILPIKHLRNQPAKARGQVLFGEPTEIEWNPDTIVFPTLDLNRWPSEPPEGVELGPDESWPTPAEVRRAWRGIPTGFGAIIDVTSMEGEIRGRHHVTATGRTIRPDLAVADDPQTKQSAKSLGQVDDRGKTVASDIAYLNGPTEPIGVVVPCTVICEGDLASRLLDRKISPEYRGEVTKMVEEFPPGWEDGVLAAEADGDSETVKLWREYRRLQLEGLETETRTKKGERLETDFYRRHRREMDKGFRVSWPERFIVKKGELSGIQHAANLFFRDPESFYAEAQNDPSRAVGTSKVSRALVSSELLERSSGARRGIVPDRSDLLVGFVDVSESVLWWTVVGVQTDGLGLDVVDFGTWPDQRQNHYRLGALRHTLQRDRPGDPFASVLVDALDAVTTFLAVDRRWVDESGDERSIDALGVDSGWGEYALDVYRFCRRSDLRSILNATKGVGVTATQRPLVDPEAKPKKGVRESILGQWKQTRTKVRTPLLQFDTNFWKSRIADAARVTTDSRSSLRLPEGSTTELRVLAEQLSAESPKRVKSRLREVDQWSAPPGRDNHFLDCLVGCAVLGHKLGAKLPEGAKVRTVQSAKAGKAKKREEAESVSRGSRSRRRGSSVNF